MVRSAARTCGHAALWVALSGLILVRWLDPALDRPLQHDELLTLEKYTIAGIDADGSPRRIRRVEDVANGAGLTPLRFAAGLHRSVGVWQEPNNHVVHSALVTVIIAAGGRTPRAIRLPAFAGAVIAAVGMSSVCKALSGSTSGALLGIATWLHPYVATYSVTARGYSWSMALAIFAVQTGLGLIARPVTVQRRTALFALSVGLVLNTPPTLLWWVLPLYLVVAGDGGARETAQRERAQNRVLYLDVIAVCFVAGVFFVPHSPYVYASQRQYGLDPGACLLGDPSFRRLFAPDVAWTGVTVVGLAAASVAWLGSQGGALGRFSTLAVLATASHAVLAARSPYPRSLPHLVLLTMFGWGRIFMWVRGSRTSRLVAVIWVGAPACLGLVTLARGEAGSGVHDPQIEAAMATRRREDAGRPVRIVLPPIEDYVLAKYLPPTWRESWESLGEGAVGEQVLAIWVTGRPGQASVSLVEGNTTVRRLYPCAGRCEWHAENAGLVVASGRIQALGGGDYRHPSWVGWVFDPLEVQLDGSPILEYARRRRLPFVRRDVFVVVKIERVGVLRALEFLPRDAEEYAQTVRIVSEGIRTYGGAGFEFIAEDQPAPPRAQRISADPSDGRDGGAS